MNREVRDGRGEEEHGREDRSIDAALLSVFVCDVENMNGLLSFPRVSHRLARRTRAER